MDNRFAFDNEIGGSGSFLLTSHGCFQRHNKTREEQELTKKESRIRNFETYNRTEHEERGIQNKLARYFNQGYKLRPNESAEAFIARIEET